MAEEIHIIAAESEAEGLREKGKLLYFNEDETPENKQRGLRYILQAYHKKDPEAYFIVAKLTMDGILHCKTCTDQQKHAMELMNYAAFYGCIQARAYLNKLSEDRYRAAFPEANNTAGARGPLVGFDGKPIRINRTGIRTPVDAVLTYENGRNVLTLSTDLQFLYMYPLDVSQEDFEDAVIKGIKDWEGDYTVFGGQQLCVRVQLTKNENLYDNVRILPLEKQGREHCVRNLSALLPKNDSRANRGIQDLKNQRSVASTGILTRWSTTTRKNVFIMMPDDRFDNPDEIRNITKHEFGHVIGLGDLYMSPSDDLSGVKNGAYKELDCYEISERSYNLVMCYHYGPVSNNDIEMVVLAFSENKGQNYQKQKFGEISEALGKGN